MVVCGVGRKGRERRTRTMPEGGTTPGAKFSIGLEERQDGDVGRRRLSLMSTGTGGQLDDHERLALYERSWQEPVNVEPLWRWRRWWRRVI